MLNSFILSIRGSQLVLALMHFFTNDDVSHKVIRKETIARSAVIFDASEHSRLMGNGIALA